MLATRKFNEVKTTIAPNADGSITLTRPAGVCRTLTSPSEYLADSAVDCTFRPNAETRALEVSSGETVLTLADEIGIKGDLDFEITFINENTALVELVNGVLYNKNAVGAEFGFNAMGNLIRNTVDVKWLSVKELFKAVSDRLMHYYNVGAKEVVDYVYNATFKFSTSYEVCSKTERARTGCYNTYRQRISDWTVTIAMGEFDFIVFEPEETTPIQRGLPSFRPTVKNVEDMSYDEQQEYYRQQEEAEARAEREAEEARLDSYGDDFDDSDFDEYIEDDEFDGYDDENFDDFD